MYSFTNIMMLVVDTKNKTILNGFINIKSKVYGYALTGYTFGSDCKSYDIKAGLGCNF